ncbi:MAG: alanine--glyoxylate aminotransferase family protein [Synergistaceae bacterium]|jgi:aspartate aminotransferase-like enzyme|nr:alanine--glyoxylate aminotransferase family protein [Synergistaceae bacterium]
MIETPKLLMIPGPTPVVRSIQNQMARETVAFGDAGFIADFKGLVAELKALWRCDGEAFVLAGSGTMAMEMAVANITKRGENVLICSHGYFGDRFIDICARKGLGVDVLKAEWGTVYTPEQIDAELSKKEYAALTVTHVDTATGAEAPLKEICVMLKKKHPGVLLIVDAVAAAGGAESWMDWGIDVLFTCSQKAFGVAPGLAMLWASGRALAKRKSLGTIPESYFDFERWIPVMQDPSKYWGTPPVNMIWALKEGLRLMKEEGLEERYARHIRQAAVFVAAMEALGFKTAASKENRAPTLSIFFYPENSGLDDLPFRAKLAEEGVQSAGCLGAFAGKGFRLGHMGNIDKHVLVGTIASVERACVKCGYQVELGKGLGVLQAGLVRE